jgi:hypothetical protein
MSFKQHDSEGLQFYRAKAAELGEFRHSVAGKIGSVYIDEARRTLDELKVRTEELEKLRARLQPKDHFIAKYSILAYNEHAVSFVVPGGCSRLQILQEAQALVGGRGFIDPKHLEEWQTHRVLVVPVEYPERICIDGHVEGLDAKTRRVQEELLRQRKLTMPVWEDLVVAFAAFYVATGQPIFRWSAESSGWSFAARAAGGTLHFHDGLLKFGGVSDVNTDLYIAASARMSPLILGFGL